MRLGNSSSGKLSQVPSPRYYTIVDGTTKKSENLERPTKTLDCHPDNLAMPKQSTPGQCGEFNEAS